MSEMKHTDGPWSVGTLRGNDGSHRVMSRRGRIGTVDYRSVFSKRAYDELDYEGRGNAHLIAAAPELLEATERALSFLRSMPDADNVGLIPFLVAAIAKAEGR